MGAANASSPASAVTLSSGAVLDLNGFSTAIGSLAGAGNVTLGSGALTSGSDGSSTIFSGVIGGPGAFTKTGAGALTLSGSNTYTGATIVDGGSLVLGAAERLANASAVTVAAGATLNLNGFNETLGSLAGAGSVTLGAGALTVGANGTSTSFSGVMSGAGTLTKIGAGTQALSGANSYSGLTTISAGALKVQSAAGLGDTAAGTTVNSGAELQLQGDVAIGAESLSLGGAGVSGAGALRNVADDNSFDGAITLATASTIGADAGSRSAARCRKGRMRWRSPALAPCSSRE